MTARGPRVTPYAKWLLRARPEDYLLAVSTAGASLPVVGRHLRPLGTITAMGVWGVRHAPNFVSSVARDRLAAATAEERRRHRDSAREVSVAALRGIVPAADLDAGWPEPQTTPPVWDALRQRRYVFRRGVHYGDNPAQTLDVWRRKDLPGVPAPVLVFVPGGAWVHGSSALQGSALMSRLADQGWVCLAIDYGVSPHRRWQRHISDVKTAVAWARANVDKFGGDRDFVAVAGCSAGGHLAALAGLTPNDPHYDARLPEGADSSVDAVVGIYGRYDWEDRSTIDRVQRNAPPFLVIHGSSDSIIPVAQARSFVERLRSVSSSLVNYVELPGAGHGFDLIDGLRAGATAHATALFLNQVHRNRAQLGKEIV